MASPRKLFFYPVLAFIVALSLTTCFSAYRGDTGTLVFSLQNPGNSRLIMDPVEVETLEHEIILKGPGGTITRKITGSGVLSIELVPGSWYVKVRAIGDRPEDYKNLFNETTMLRAMGMETVEVKAGQRTPAKINLFSATEVTSWEQLSEVINIYSEFLDEKRREGIIVVKGELFARDFIPIEDIKITLMTEGDDATIFRSVAYDTEEMYEGPFFEISDKGKLILKGEDGAELILDGENEQGVSYYSLLFLYNGGSLEMYDGAVLQNNHNQVDWPMGGAVYVSSNSKFTMHGGIIRNNTAYQGGGVLLWNGTFDMKGGVIYGNRAESFVEGTATGYGGGVYVQYEGTFSKTGGIIYGINDGKWKNTADTGNGDAVFVQMKYNSESWEVIRPERQKNYTAGRGTNLNSENEINWDNEPPVEPF